MKKICTTAAATFSESNSAHNNFIKRGMAQKEKEQRLLTQNSETQEVPGV